MTKSSRRVALAASLLLCSSLALADGVPSNVIEPGQAYLPVGQSQAFQLLDADGNDKPSSDWSLSDAEIADLQIVDGHANVLAKAPGLLFLSNGSGAQLVKIEVHDGKLPQDARWLLRPIDGQFVDALWASGTWGGSAADADPPEDSPAAYFYEDRGPNSAHLRAIRSDGLQAWQWPSHPSREIPKMVCGDIYGGVLIRLGDVPSRVLVDLDAKGQERWRASVPGFSGKEFSFQMNGVFYLLEENPSKTLSRIVALDAKTGHQRALIDLPSSGEILHGLAVRNDKVICVPGTTSSNPLPFRHSKLMTNTLGVANLAYSEYHLAADSGECVPGSVVDLQKIHIKVTQRLMMVDIYENLTTSSFAIKEGTAEGFAADTWIQATGPTGDIIVGEEGTGNFLAVRTTRQLWRGTGPGSIEEFQFRIADDRTVKYSVPVPLSPISFPTGMLLGENNLGYTTRGNIVIAFDTETGRELWRWASPRSNVIAWMALKDNRLVLRERDKYIVLKDGKPESFLDDSYMLFVAKFVLDPEDL